MRKSKFIIMCLLMLFMTACGTPSKEKIKEVQSVYAEVVDLHNEVVAEYADLDDDTLSEELNTIAEGIKKIGGQDAMRMTDAELDDTIKELKQSIALYDGIQAKVKALKEGKEEIYAIPVTLRNDTGIALYEMYLYKASETDKGDNLVEDMGFLEGNQTCSISNLYMTKDEMLWHLEALDEDGNMIESADIDLSGYDEDGVTVIMKFSFDDMEGWLEIE